MNGSHTPPPPPGSGLPKRRPIRPEGSIPNAPTRATVLETGPAFHMSPRTAPEVVASDETNTPQPVGGSPTKRRPRLRPSGGWRRPRLALLAVGLVTALSSPVTLPSEDEASQRTVPTDSESGPSPDRTETDRTRRSIAPDTGLPSTSQSPSGDAPATIPAEPSELLAATAPLRVAMVGDSMFSLGHEEILAAVEASPGVEVTHFVAESGSRVDSNSELEGAVADNPDVLVLSFQINDLVAYGPDEALTRFDDFMARIGHIRCVRWVTFYSADDFEPMVAGLESLTGRHPNLETIGFHELLEAHREWRFPHDTPFGGDIHLDPDSNGPNVLGQLIADNLDCRPEPVPG